MKKYRKKIFILARPAFGIVDGKQGGVIVSSRCLLEQLDNLSIPYTVIDTYRKKLKFLAWPSILINSFRKIKSCEIVFLNLNEREIVYFGVPIVFFSWILKKRILVRFFGGNLDILFLKKLYKFSISYIFSKSDKLLLQTKYLCKYFDSEKCYWFPTSRTLKLGKRFTPLNTKPLRIVFIGNVSKTKGVDLLISAAKILRRDIEINVFGVLEDISIHELQEAGISYCGILPNDRVHETLFEFDYLCLPTRHIGEGYPGIIIEAFIAGVPVIASNWRAIPELVIENKTGFLFQPNDVKQLVAAIKKAKRFYKESTQFDFSEATAQFNAEKIYEKLALELLR